MHQIRVHLQWLGVTLISVWVWSYFVSLCVAAVLGYPIVNDPLYNHSAWGPNRGKKGEGIASVDAVSVGHYLTETNFIDLFY